MDSTSNAVDLDLTLSVKPSYVPKSLSNLLNDFAQFDRASAKLAALETCLQKHIGELHRIQAFDGDHELPHCTLLLKDAIQEIESKISIIKNGNAEAGHHTVLLIWKRRNQPENSSSLPSKHDLVSMVRPKKWSRKGKLESIGKNLMTNLNINIDDSTTINNHSSPLSIEILRNGRRVWTPELHTIFMKAMTDLGGPEAAAPKPLRDRMRVKGLTSDQVKSHLQKFRIYKRAGLQIPQAGAGSSTSALSADNLHQPSAMSQEQWTHQREVPYTRDFFGTASSPAHSHSSN